MWISKEEFKRMQDAIVLKEKEIKVLTDSLVKKTERKKELNFSYDFKYKSGRPTLIFKLGDRQKGYVLNKDHRDALAKLLKEAHVDDKHNILFHYNVDVEKID